MVFARNLPGLESPPNELDMAPIEEDAGKMPAVHKKIPRS